MPFCPISANRYDSSHYTYYERGRLGFDRAGSLDDVLYWYCEGVVSGAARFDDRKVRELATRFRDWGKPDDIALLPDIGEPL
ncbi:MAG: hypothetical protein QOJ24_387 [Mycobacterium sp.]|nr:hypothetical protein [Mycobacterium sp.]